MRPIEGNCRNCGERPATNLWLGDGSTMDMMHGGGEPWCRVCILTAQLARAKERAAVIPDLERELASELAEGANPNPFPAPLPEGGE